jgi:hypothetical protein
MADRSGSHARAQNVLMAVDLARHSALGWDNAALPDDYKAIAALLNLQHEELLQRIERTARQADAARAWYLPGTSALPQAGS